MNPYELALYFWSTLAAIVVAVPFLVASVRGALHGAGRAHDPHSEPSLPSIPSWPSSPA